MNDIRIEYPQFPEEVEVAKKRRARYFLESDFSKLPKKYLPHPEQAEISALADGLKWKHGKLYNSATKSFVVANPGVASKPRYMPIGGNTFMRMRFQMQQKIVQKLLEVFKEKLQVHVGGNIPENVWGPAFEIDRPVRISMEVHTFPGRMNWDLSNLWPYTKCFEDALQDSGCLLGDDIKWVAFSGGVDFFPISREEDRKMVFIIREETNSTKLTHLMYWSRSPAVSLDEPYYPLEWQTTLPFESFDLDVVRTGDVGDVIVDMYGGDADNARVTMNVGKSDIVKDTIVQTTFQKVVHQCFQLNMVPFIEKALWIKWESHFREFFLKRGIPVYVDGR